MPAATTLTVMALALAAGATAYQVKESKDAREDAEDQAKKQSAEQRALLEEEKKKESMELGRAAQSQAKTRGQPGAAPRSNTFNMNAAGMAGYPASPGGKTLIGQ